MSLPPATARPTGRPGWLIPNRSAVLRTPLLADGCELPAARQKRRRPVRVMRRLTPSSPRRSAPAAPALPAPRHWRSAAQSPRRAIACGAAPRLIAQHQRVPGRLAAGDRARCRRARRSRPPARPARSPLRSATRPASTRSFRWRAGVALSCRRLPRPAGVLLALMPALVGVVQLALDPSQRDLDRQAGPVADLEQELAQPVRTCSSRSGSASPLTSSVVQLSGVRHWCSSSCSARLRCTTSARYGISRCGSAASATIPQRSTNPRAALRSSSSGRISRSAIVCVHSTSPTPCGAVQPGEQVDALHHALGHAAARGAARRSPPGSAGAARARGRRASGRARSAPARRPSRPSGSPPAAPWRCRSPRRCRRTTGRSRRIGSLVCRPNTDPDFGSPTSARSDARRFSTWSR